MDGDNLKRAFFGQGRKGKFSVKRSNKIITMAIGHTLNYTIELIIGVSSLSEMSRRKVKKVKEY